MVNYYESFIVCLPLQPQTTSERVVVYKGDTEKKKDANAPEPDFMLEKREGFKKFGKQYITTNQLQVSILD